MCDEVWGPGKEAGWLNSCNGPTSGQPLGSWLARAPERCSSDREPLQTTAAIVTGWEWEVVAEKLTVVAHCRVYMTPNPESGCLLHA